MSSSYHYDMCPTSISGNSNPVLTEKRTYSQAREQPTTRVLVQNVDEDKKKKRVAPGCRR
jgi:hypothetical protein